MAKGYMLLRRKCCSPFFLFDATKDKTHLIAWRKRVGEKKAQEITTEAPGVGTRMHKYPEDYVETGEWSTRQ